MKNLLKIFKAEIIKSSILLIGFSIMFIMLLNFSNKGSQSFIEYVLRLIKF